MAEKEKRSKKGLFALLAAAAGGLLFFLKRKKGRAGEESGWEEVSPNP